MSRFGLYLFSTNEAFIRTAIAAGVDGIVVDWEDAGKERRQANADTQINHDTLADLQRVRRCTTAPIICRVNNSAELLMEAESAIGAGADEILVPMVRDPRTVRAVLDLADGRAGVGVLIETVDAVERASEIAGLPISRAYVGLNDLSIERCTPSIFTAVADGTVELLRNRFSVPFGFGGLTLPAAGHPIPCNLLMSEMVRLRCDFTMLRRSFLADVPDPRKGLPMIRYALTAMSLRPAARTRTDHAALLSCIRALDAPLVPT
jgi:hypothetical protein